MKRWLLSIPVAVLCFVACGTVQAQDWGYRGSWHDRYHDELDHRDFHRELEHRDVHRYPMTRFEHEELHDYLEHQTYHDELEHRAAHRARSYNYGNYYHRHDSHYQGYGSRYNSGGVGINGRRFSLWIGY